MNYYKIYGKQKIDIVVEMGLGACIEEWEHIAKQLSVQYGVMLYERAGINRSNKSANQRTPSNIAKELYDMLEKI